MEKDVFKALKEAFSVNDLLQHLTLWSFFIEEATKPFIVFQGESFGENTALIHLVIESDYKGLAESSILKKEIKSVLSSSSLAYEDLCYSFKEEHGNQKNNALTFRVKHFKTGV